MASVRAPVTVTLSARAPPVSRSKPARLTLFALLLERVTVDRGAVSGSGRRREAPDPGRMPACP